MGLFRLSVCCAVLVALLVSLAGPAAAAFDLSTSSKQRVIGKLTEQRIVLRYDDGDIARGRVLRFPEKAPNLELRPRLGQRTAAGLETMPSMARKTHRHGAAAGVNGGYFLPRPTGVPNGLYVHAGRMVAGQAAGRNGRQIQRGAVGIAESGALVMDRLDVELTLTTSEGAFTIDEINRQPRTAGPSYLKEKDELLLFDPLFGAPVEVPAGSVVVETNRLPVASSGQVARRVQDVRRYAKKRTLEVPAKRSLLVAYDKDGATNAETKALSALVEGQLVRVSTEIAPLETDPQDWTSLRGALPGAPLLLRGGYLTTLSQWRDEALGDDHLIRRHPRTAIARTAGGDVLLVTIDGRQPGWSDGATLAELRDALIELGAVDVLNLDGGGSTTMTVGKDIRNRPSEKGRYQSSALFVHAPLPPGARDLRKHACDPDDVRDPGFRDTAGTTHEQAIDCMAWWDITSGVTKTQYEPEQQVSRAQMASFIARFIDVADGQRLPGATSSPFRDVDIDSTHGRSIARLAKADIVQGVSEDRYRPRGTVTRAQMSTFIAKAVSYVRDRDLPDRRDTFIDDNGNVHEDAIEKLARAGIVAGVEGLLYAPQRAVRRGSMASFVMRGADLLVEEGTSRPPS